MRAGCVVQSAERSFVSEPKGVNSHSFSLLYFFVL
jgi:hypothetical protein